jgi:hypothetical protein
MNSSLLALGPTARLLSVPAAWLRAEADAGRLPCLRAGPKYLFDVDTVERLLLERARQNNQEADSPNSKKRRVADTG